MPDVMLEDRVADLLSADAMWATMRPTLEQLLAAPRAPQRIPKVPGIYLFSDGERYRYVGQTRDLSKRLAQHTQPSGTHYGATLAFLIAKEQPALAGANVRQRRRALQSDTAFVSHFVAAKAQVAGWDIQFIQVDDPNVQTVFEVFVHLVLHTDLNTFETH